MNIKKLVKYSFLVISILIIFISTINSIALYQLKENSISKKNIVKLVSLQEDMNSLVKDLAMSSSIDMLNKIKDNFHDFEKQFEYLKKSFIYKDVDDFIDKFITDIHKNKIIDKNLQLLFTNEKEIEVKFDKIYNLQKEKIILLNNFNIQYPKEKNLRGLIEESIVGTTNIDIIKSFGRLNYYSKEALFQHRNNQYIDKWLDEVYYLKKKLHSENKYIDEYINIVKKLSTYTLKIKNIENLELKLQDELFKIININKKVNLDIENDIENLSEAFMNYIYLIMILLTVFTMAFIVLLEYKVSKNIALGVNEIETKVEDGLYKIKHLNKEIETTQQEVVFTMGAIGEQRSKETGNHVKRVAEYSKLFALYYGLSKEDAEMLKQASPMHDIGKVAIPDKILNKPGRFTDEERKVMNTHVELGYNMLKSSTRPLLKIAAIVAKEHHEKWDGSGYPDKKSGKDIHIYGRITAIADVFDALGSSRVYKEAWDDERIFKLFKEEKGKHFEPKLVDIFFENLDEFLKIRNNLIDKF